MSAQSALKHQARIVASGGHHLQVMLDGASHRQLADLCTYHRLDRREVITRLIMGEPLGGRGCSRQQELGMCNEEWQAYIAGGGQ